MTYRLIRLILAALLALALAAAPSFGATSQNGRPALDAAHTKRWRVPDTQHRLALADSPAGYVLASFAFWYHRKVERIDRGVFDDWGWAYRPIRGATTGLSNHASGTAVDLNATQHPLGTATAATFTPQQQRLIRRRLARKFHGVIRWGGDYSGRPDPMHFEIVGTPAQVASVAASLRKSEWGRWVWRANH